MRPQLSAKAQKLARPCPSPAGWESSSGSGFDDGDGDGDAAEEIKILPRWIGHSHRAAIIVTAAPLEKHRPAEGDGRMRTLAAWGGVGDVEVCLDHFGVCLVEEACGGDAEG